MKWPKFQVVITRNVHYISVLRAQIGRYACHYGITAASRFFSGKLKHDVSQSTILSIRDAYLEAVKENRAMEDIGDIESLPVKKRRRRVLLGDNLDAMVQTCLKKV